MQKYLISYVYRQMGESQYQYFNELIDISPCQWLSTQMHGDEGHANLLNAMPISDEDYEKYIDIIG